MDLYQTIWDAISGPFTNGQTPGAILDKQKADIHKRAPSVGALDTTTVSLKTFLSMHGWRGDDLDTMTAVTLAEGGSEIDSKGNIKCRANFAGCCWGPFQINLNAHNVGKDVACDWNKAATFSYGLYTGDKNRGGTGFTDWQAYTTGAYKRQLGKDIQINANTTALNTAVDAASKAVGKTSVGAAINSAVSLLKNLLDPSFWLRSGKVIFGALIVLIAITAFVWALLKPAVKAGAKVTKTANVAVNTATKAAKIVK